MFRALRQNASAASRSAEPAHKSTLRFHLRILGFIAIPSALVNLDRLTTMHESCQSNELLKGEESPWIYGIQLRRVDRMGRIRVVMWTLRPPVVARLRWSLNLEHYSSPR